MKRVTILCLLLALFTSLSGCVIPTPVTAGETPMGVTPPPGPSITPLPPTPTGTYYPPVTPPPGPSITPLPPTPTGTYLPPVTPPPGPSLTPLPPTPTGTYIPPVTPPPQTETPGAPTGAISLDLLKNFTYTVESPNVQVALQNGVYQGDKIHSSLVEPAAFGDLNGDGRPDAAVVLATNLGGSGTFYDLVALLDENGKPVQAGYSPFGDRQVVKNLQIADGRVILDYITQGLKDPSCCPNEHRLRSYLLDGGALHLASEQILDSPTAQATPLPDAILIDQPLMWDKLTIPVEVRGRVSIVPPEKKLEYDVTDLNATLLMQGEVPLTGEPGGPGTFAFTIPLDTVAPGIIKVELFDSANGILRGRSMVELSAP